MLQVETYTHGHHDSVLRSHRWRNVDNSAAYLRPHLRAGMRLLDVGCGPGTLTLDLARHIPSGQVVALDRAEAVLSEARQTLSESATPVRVVEGDVYQLPFVDGSFDVVHAHQVIQHLSDPVRALHEMRRVCVQGGVVAVRDSDYGSFRWFPEDSRLDAWLSMYIRVAQRNRAYPDAGRRLPSWARDAEFREVTVSASAWAFSLPEERAWWANLWAERVIESSLGKQALEYGISTLDELSAMAAGFRAWAASEGGFFTLTHGEILAAP